MDKKSKKIPRNFSFWKIFSQIDIFSLDKVIVPVHLGSHWCLAVINIRDKRFEYYDSLGGPNAQCFKVRKKNSAKIPINFWEK